MSTKEQTQKLRVRPLVEGTRFAGRVFVRLAESPRYLCLTENELQIVKGLIEEPHTVQELLADQFTGSTTLGLRDLIRLLKKLSENGFFEDVTPGLRDYISSYDTASRSALVAALENMEKKVRGILDVELLNFEQARLHSSVIKIGEFAGNWLGLGLTTILAVLAIVGMVYQWPAGELIQVLEQPESLFVRVAIAMGLAGSWLAIWQIAVLASMDAKFVGGHIKLSALCVLRIDVDDRDAWLFNRTDAIRYHLGSLIAPWMWAGVAWLTQGAAGFSGLGTALSGAFVLYGVLMLCPLYRSPLIKLAECYLATDSVLASARRSLSRDIIPRRGQEKITEPAVRNWISGLVSLALVWLYGFGMTVADAFLTSIPDLVVNIVVSNQWDRQLASAALLAGLGLTASVPLIRIAMIPVQNIFAATSLPLRRMRNGIGSYAQKGVPPSDAVCQFLQSIPALAHLSNEAIKRLVPELKYRRVAQGFDIIKQGEQGQEFYILADGQAQVIVETPSGDEVVDILNPGDSFGEIALIEDVARTASVRSLTPAKVLCLTRKAFNQLFPDESEERNALTATLRITKLLQESDALSHLSPSETRSLLNTMDRVSFAAGDTVVSKGEEGDAAYLIESGELSVRDENGVEIHLAKRGALVGTIALVRNTTRTADVVASTDARCLKISRAQFQQMCLANIFVALIVQDLADEQILENSRHGRAINPNRDQAS